MPRKIFLHRPWVASVVLSVILLTLTGIFYSLGMDLIYHALFVLVATYALFLVCAIRNVGYTTPLRPRDPARCKAKTWALGWQLLLILVFAQVAWFGTSDSIYGDFLEQMGILLPLYLLLPVYVAWVDRRMPDPEDDYAAFGRWLLARGNLATWRNHQSFLLKSLVKMVFVPFMFGGLLGNISALLNTHVNNVNDVTTLIFNIVLNIDMVVGAFGYLFSTALLNNQIKDTDKNFLGWFYCLSCYPPLVLLMLQVNHQYDFKIWSDFMTPDMPLYWLFFIVVNGLWVIYLMSSFSFGMSFSNLSWRYLIDFGVFRYTKHPAYIAKNIYWWVTTLPFLGVPWFSSQWWGNMLGMTFVSLIYYGRAKSEERHLSQFPEYRAYMARIEREGIFRWLNKSYWQQRQK